MIPINDLLALITSVFPKIEAYLPEESKKQVKDILDKHQQDFSNQLSQANVQAKKTKKESIWVTSFMTLLLLIIGVNYLILPIFNLFKPISCNGVLPDQLWTLIIIVIPTHLGLKSLDRHLPDVIDKVGKKPKSE